MSKQKKTLQLGMNPSTASGRLVKDTLFRLAVEAGHKCHHCGDELTRDTFSIEHINPWLDSENPVELYFDQDNIAFSHLTCNIKAGRRPTKGNCQSKEEKRVKRAAYYQDKIKDPEFVKSEQERKRKYY